MSERIDVFEVLRRGIFDAVWRGEMIARSTRTPLFDSARVLRDRSFTGNLEMWGGDPPKLRMSWDIEEAAKLTVMGDHVHKFQGEAYYSPKGGRSEIVP
jgi:hypothetical protein